ncbi:MAG: SGNH/GDSL hydrolase family protein [Planctomycetota bacterium]|nr:SGNH/GDSL hydrolase family protein [Planctomycetota bacterium]
MRHYHHATVPKSVSIGCLVVWMVAMCSPCLVPAVACQEDAWYQRHDDWNGFSRYHFQIGQQAAYLVAPDEPAAGRPWVWRARFPNYHAEIDIELLKRGFHVGYVDVAGLFGNPAAVEIGDHFYRYVCQHASLNPRPSLEGVSRGGLLVYQWAAKNPDKVRNIFCDTPVCDIRSWPGGKGEGRGAAAEWKQCLEAYGISEEAVDDSDASIVQHAELLAAANIPILHIVTEDDQIVPPQENTYVLSERLEQLGHPMRVLSIEHGKPESRGHHFDHPDIQPIVDFLVHQQAPDRSLLARVRGARRIVFLGDSITYSGEYVARLEAALRSGGWADPEIMINVGLPSETVSGLSEEGHAGGRFPRPELAERLERVLETTRPDLVFACYGINCGIYQPLEEQRFKKYQQGIQQLKSKVEAAGAELILITPPTFDDQRANRKFSYDAVMSRYTDWLNEQKKQGWNVLDLHTPMAQALQARRESEPSFTFQPDAVHPNQAGHEQIAAILLGQLLAAEDDPSQPNSAELDAETLRLIRQRSHLWRDAYLTASGHTRPGIKSGESLEMARQTSAPLTEQIDRRLKQSGDR